MMTDRAFWEWWGKFDEPTSSIIADKWAVIAGVTSAYVTDALPLVERYHPHVLEGL